MAVAHFGQKGARVPVRVMGLLAVIVCVPAVSLFLFITIFGVGWAALERRDTAIVAGCPHLAVSKGRIKGIIIGIK